MSWPYDVMDIVEREHKLRARDRRVAWVASAIGAVVFAGILIGVHFGNATVCNWRWPDHDSHYGLTTGCMVSIDGKRIPEDRVRFD